MPVRRAHHDAPLDTCPVCGSHAVNGSGREALTGGTWHWVLRCGECGTWRAYDADRPASRRAMGRFRWRLLCDRWRMIRALQRAEHVGVEPDLRALAVQRERGARPVGGSRSDPAGRP